MRTWLISINIKKIIVLKQNSISFPGFLGLSEPCTKLGRMLTYFDKQKSLYIHNQSAYGYKLGRMLTYLDEFLPIKSHQPLITWSCKITSQTKTIMSPYHSVYGHKTCQDGDYLDRFLTIVIQSFDHVVLQGHVTNKNHYISITRVPMAIKFDRMMTFLDGLLPVMSRDPLITRPCEI